MKRSKMDIVFDILSTVQNDGPILPTRLLYKANMSHSRLKSYLQDLEAKQFLKLNDGKYVLEDEGHKFLSNYSQLRKFVDAFGF